jgi:hypothetical protein
MKSQYRVCVLLVLLSLLSACKTAVNEEQPFVSPLAPTSAEAAVPPSPQPSRTQSAFHSPLSSEGIEPTASPPAQPLAGQATVIGQVTLRSTGAPIPGIAVRLAEVHRQGDGGAFVLDDAFSPGSTADDLGRFVIENVAAEEYVIVVGNVNTLYEIVAEPSGKARVWEIPADQIFDVGDLRVEPGP